MVLIAEFYNHNKNGGFIYFKLVNYMACKLYYLKKTVFPPMWEKNPFVCSVEIRNCYRD